MSAVTIRRLTTEDLPFADRLRAAEGWNQTRRDWERLLAHQPEGCFLATWQGAPAGVVTTTVHSGELAWIGMMLVQTDFRRRGIATALIEHCLDFLDKAGVRCIKLDATPAGTPVYERLGFRIEWPWQRRAIVSPRVPHIPIAPTERFPHYGWDADIFGADRQVWLSRVAPDARLICEQNGYAMLRPGSRAGYVGPIAARDAATAERLICQLLAATDGHYLWDIPAHNAHGVALAESLGFQPTRDLNRMWTGRALIEGQPELQYGFADPGTG